VGVIQNNILMFLYIHKYLIACIYVNHVYMNATEYSFVFYFCRIKKLSWKFLLTIMKEWKFFDLFPCFSLFFSFSTSCWCCFFGKQKFIWVFSYIFHISWCSGNMKKKRIFLCVIQHTKLSWNAAYGDYRRKYLQCEKN
jgi:hypothetical protein